MVAIWCFSEYKNQRLLYFMFSIQIRNKQTDIFTYTAYVNLGTTCHAPLKKPNMFPSTPSIHMGTKCNCTNSYRTKAQAYERNKSHLTQETSKVWITRGCRDIAVLILFALVLPTCVKESSGLTQKSCCLGR